MEFKRRSGKMFFSRKCPYCKGKNLYLKRTSPIEKWGCKDCEKKIKIMRENGMSDKDIKKIICT